MADEAKGGELTDEGLKEKGNGLPIMVVVILSVVLIVGGLGAGLFLGKQKGGEVQAVDKPSETVIVVALESIFVNIAETKSTRVLKLNPVLELSEERLIPVVEARIPLIRDLVSEAACRLSIDALDGQNGRQILKREIKNQMNVMLRNHMAGAVKDVYFSDFLIQ